jgi:NitT/TauT family transport system substrate-binding protein
MLRSLLRAVVVLACASTAVAQDKFVFATDWFAQAEHGGFYQAVAEGTYKKHGLDVTIRMGGPQVNGLQLLAAGQIDAAMADGLQVLSAVENAVPVTAIGATFQKNPTVIIAHPGVASLEALRGKPIAVSAAANTTFWPWLKQTLGFTDAQKRPYGFSVQPFLVDPNLSQQGFATSEPYSIEKGGIKPVVFLLADLGYPPYSEVVAVKTEALATRRDVLRRFTQASAEGWKSYLANPAPGNALIRKDNPQMTDELLDYGVRKMREYNIVGGGNAMTQGIMTMSDDRWLTTVEFLRVTGMAKANVDYRKAWTTDVVKDMRVLP